MSELFLRLSEWVYRLMLFGAPLVFLFTCLGLLTYHYPGWVLGVLALAVIGWIIYSVITAGWLLRVATSLLVQISREG